MRSDMTSPATKSTNPVDQVRTLSSLMTILFAPATPSRFRWNINFSFITFRRADRRAFRCYTGTQPCVQRARPIVGLQSRFWITNSTQWNWSTRLRSGCVHERLCSTNLPWIISQRYPWHFAAILSVATSGFNCGRSSRCSKSTMIFFHCGRLPWKPFLFL